MRFAVVAIAFVACSSEYSESAPPADGGTTPPASDAAASACNGNVDCERIVFVSSDSGDGKPGTVGGVQGADELCQRLADASARTRGRKFRAWLSTASTPATGRLPLGTKPYRRTDGVEVAASLSEILVGPLKNPINVDENGQIVPTSEVWTGTDAKGNPTGGHCNEWTATSQVAGGRRGNAARTDTHWTNDTDAPCDAEGRFYCFEN